MARSPFYTINGTQSPFVWAQDAVIDKLMPLNQRDKHSKEKDSTEKWDLIQNSSQPLKHSIYTKAAPANSGYQETFQTSSSTIFKRHLAV